MTLRFWMLPRPLGMLPLFSVRRQLSAVPLARCASLTREIPLSSRCWHPCVLRNPFRVCSAILHHFQNFLFLTRFGMCACDAAAVGRWRVRGRRRKRGRGFANRLWGSFRWVGAKPDNPVVPVAVYKNDIPRDDEIPVVVPL